MVIDEALVRRLLATHAPALAALPVAPLPGGWDNRSFRLGERLVLRLPNAERYAASLTKEAQVLPRLAPHLPLPIPQLVLSVPAGPLLPRP